MAEGRSGRAKGDWFTQAADFARSYNGSFPFMLEMRSKAKANPMWRPTPRQTKAIHRCRKFQNDLPAAPTGGRVAFRTGRSPGR